MQSTYNEIKIKLMYRPYGNLTRIRRPIRVEACATIADCRRFCLLSESASSGQLAAERDDSPERRSISQLNYMHNVIDVAENQAHTLLRDGTFQVLENREHTLCGYRTAWTTLEYFDDSEYIVERHYWRTDKCVNVYVYVSEHTQWRVYQHTSVEVIYCSDTVCTDTLCSDTFCLLMHSVLIHSLLLYWLIHYVLIHYLYVKVHV